MELSEAEFYHIIIVIIIVFFVLIDRLRNSKLAQENFELRKRLEEYRRRYYSEGARDREERVHREQAPLY